jgi:hypothetical protein
MMLKTDMAQLTDGKEGKFFISLKIVSPGATHDSEFAKATVSCHHHDALLMKPDSSVVACLCIDGCIVVLCPR